MAHFQIPRNLPHAATLARRIHARLVSVDVADNPDAATLMSLVEEIQEMLDPYDGGEEPAEAQGLQVAERVAAAGREAVAEIERMGVGEDRLGQWVRNLYECLGMGEEGAELSLRAGEDPNSLMRPR
jgi:nucleotide-binding universal stress UspA family protein